MNLIVAVDSEWGIGYKGDLLARVRADLVNFKNVTSGKTVVYGIKTLYTFPRQEPLKNRKNIIFKHDPDFKVDGALVVHSVDELLSLIDLKNSSDVFVIGGASIYSQLLPYCDTAYITKFQMSFPKDTYFPNLDLSDEWKCIESGDEQVSDPETDSVDGLRFNFTVYKKIQTEII